ncbi:Eukaryotic translation initiation factor 2D [Desmophyllum pertusum]|uniref:Eukaryotic translation initiation factor 2D n=1 Tax=Desmophyllum pertusum TaxID=174260 RepID=A0A9W9Y8B7_9CNID|nr:Eukaryotic translation initiation factor 2D [Desmophyllum pertusum]
MHVVNDSEKSKRIKLKILEHTERKLRSDVSNAFPSLSQDELSEIIPNKEEITVMRLMTHSGQNVTVFCLSGEPIFFEVEKKVIPTDLMLPGIILPSDGVSALGHFEKGAVCSVCLKGNRTPVAVGTTLVSSTDLLEDGLRGKGVMIHHIYLDLLWAHGSKTPLPQLDVADDDVRTDEVNEYMQELSVDETEENSCHEEATDKTCTDGSDTQEDTENKDGGSVEQGNGINPMPASATNAGDGENEPESVDESPLLEPGDETTSRDTLLENMDDVLEYCFFCALLRMKKVELPVLTSTFSRSYLLPSCPEGKSVDIKKSSHKKLSKFLQCMQERGLISVQEACKGVDHITAIAWHHPDLKDFKANAPVVESGAEAARDPSPSNTQPPCIEELFSVSAALLPIFSQFGFSKNAVLRPSDIRSTITNYVKLHDLMSTENKRMVVLDPRLTKILINKNEDVERLPWDQLFERSIDKNEKCHQITLPGQEPIVRKGKIEAIEIKVEQRMGNKKVTLIRNLESYGIDPQEFAHNIQIKAATSTSVSQLPGKHIAPGLQVLVQGNQVAIVAKFLLDECKIPKKYISGIEQLKSGKKKK